MDFIARKFRFVPNTKILPDEWIAELDQLYRFLSGSLSAQIHIKNKLANSVLILQNTTAGKDIIVFQQSGIGKVRILETQQLKSEITSVAPFDVASTTLVTKLNAQYLDGIQQAIFLDINTRHTEFLVPLLLKDVNVTTVKAPVYIVPAGTNMSITLITAEGIGYFGDVNGVVTITIRLNGVAKLNGTLSVGGSLTSGAVNIALAENDIISITADSIDNAPGLERIHASVKIKQDLNT